MSKVYLFDPVGEEVVGIGRRCDGDVVVSEDDIGCLDRVKTIDADDFYLSDVVQGIVPKGTTRGTQIHVECMVCGFETVFGVYALIQDREYGRTELNGYPSFNCSCEECNENAWKEVERRRSPCDWSDTFEWADPI